MTKKRFNAICIARLLALVAVMCTAAPSGAQEAPARITINLLALGEDATPNSVPRGHPLFQRVAGALNEALIERGLRVYDETAVTMTFTDPKRKRRDDAYLIDVARSVSQPPIDALLIFEVVVRAPADLSSPIKQRRLSLRLAARLIGVRDGRIFARSENEPKVDLPPVAFDCRGICIADVVGDHARDIALSMAGQMADTLLAEIKK
jgi:hypothetical protein